MAGKVTVIASGETERKTLPPLCSDLGAEGIHLQTVLVPPRNGQLSVEMAARLVKIAPAQTSKIVVLLDADGKEPTEVVAPFEKYFQSWQHWQLPVLVTYAQWHLEAWFFGDPVGLRQFLGGKALGLLPHEPDLIQNPKLRLQGLLSGIYTSKIAEQVARRLSAETIASRSGSFAHFLAAVRNGTTA